jgi:hypothetical protein
MRASLIPTGALFALLGAAHLVLTLTQLQRLVDQPEFIIEGPGIGVLAGAFAIWAWRLRRALPDRPVSRR